MIFITASNGVFVLDEVSSSTEQVMNNKYRGGFFSRKSHGYFGLCYSGYLQSVLVASREKLGTPKAGKPTTDVGIHSIDAKTLSYKTVAYVKDIHDVHQMAVWKNYVLLSDTGKNRVVVFNVDKDEISQHINIGHIREDINHINAITIKDDSIYIGLNNRGKKDSEILVLSTSVLMSEEDLEAESVAEVITLKGFMHTHDIEPYGEDFLVSVSHDSVVISKDLCEPVIKGDNWVRGLHVDESSLWVGQSHFAKRSKRHAKNNEGVVACYGLASNEELNRIVLSGSGQINDLLHVSVNAD